MSILQFAVNSTFWIEGHYFSFVSGYINFFFFFSLLLFKAQDLTLKLLRLKRTNGKGRNIRSENVNERNCQRRRVHSLSHFSSFLSCCCCCYLNRQRRYSQRMGISEASTKLLLLLWMLKDCNANRRSCHSTYPQHAHRRKQRPKSHRVFYSTLRRRRRW